MATALQSAAAPLPHKGTPLNTYEMKQEFRQYLIDGEKAAEQCALAVPRRILVGATGVHIGHRPGSSLEFKDHRDYQPGDDLRRIDWGAYARSDRLVVRLHHEEVSPHLDILIDGSRSMAIEGTDKTRATITLAAFFAGAASNAGFSHAAWIAENGCKKLGNSGNQPSTWEGLEFDHLGNLAESMNRLTPSWRPQGLRVLISDLLWLADPVTTLQFFSRGAATVVVLQVLAAVDTEPPERGFLRLIDSETDEVTEINLDDTAIKRYRQSLSFHQQNWQLACRQVGAVFASVIAEEMVKSIDIPELAAAGILKVG